LRSAEDQQGLEPTSRIRIIRKVEKTKKKKKDQALRRWN